MQYCFYVIHPLSKLEFEAINIAILFQRENIRVMTHREISESTKMNTLIRCNQSNLLNYEFECISTKIIFLKYSPRSFTPKLGTILLVGVIESFFICPPCIGLLPIYINEHNITKTLSY